MDNIDRLFLFLVIWLFSIHMYTSHGLYMAIYKQHVQQTTV
jgi:hypothetical protein